MAKKHQTYEDSIPSYETVSKYPEYWKLVEWLATPTPARKPATLQLLAKELGLHFTTLSRWQRVENCYRDIRERIKKELRSDLPNVLYALKNRIYKDGSAKEIKLFLQWVDDFVEKHEVDHTGIVDFDNPEIKLAVGEFELKLKQSLFKKKHESK
jgi:hypothetical protein